MLACPRCGSSYSKDQEFCGIDGERLKELETDPMIGRTIDRYTITAPLGEGGMARVYRARHTFLEQDFAVKILFGDLASDKNVARRFQREAQAASKLKHPNVVSTIDMGQSQEGLIFMAMELLEGRTLTEVIREEGAMPPERAAFMVKQIASGLVAAHALGYVHRDLKPKNIMIVGVEETLKILDFGLVLLTDTGSGSEAAKITDATNLTQQGQVFGTPAYMAPEQCSGQTVGPAADLYALGVILYQLLAGSVPFGGQPAQIAIHHLSTPPPPLADHSGLGPIAMRLLAKKAEDRFESAAAVVAAIAAIDFASGGVAASPAWTPVSTKPAWAPARREDEALSFPGEISLISERSADFDDRQNEAIVASSRAGWFGFFGALVLLVGVGYAWFGDLWAPVQETRAAEVVEPAPVPPKREEPKREEPKREEPLPPPPPIQTKREEPAPAKEPPPQPPVQQAKPEEPVDDSPPAERRAFEQRDLSIGYHLSNRGLNWRDLVGAAPEAAQAWTLWRIAADHPTVRELETRAAELESAAAKILIDNRLLETKLERARRILGEVPEPKKDARYSALVTRYNAIRSRFLRARSDDVKERLAAEITLLESDAHLHASSADPREDLRTIEEPRLSEAPRVDLSDEPNELGDEGTLSSTTVGSF